MSEQQPTVEQKKTWHHRRTQRVLIEVPVLVYGHSPGKGPFQEATHTIQVNAHGALLALATPVERGQKLILTHMSTQEEQSCHVVYIGKERDNKMEVGVGFTHPAPRFWRIAFPPEDWKKV